MRKLLGIVCGLLTLTAHATAQSTIDTLYFLPKSVVTISGTVTSKKVFAPSGLVAAPEPGPATITLGVLADPSAFFFYTPDSKLLSKNSVTLELSERGILTSLNGVSEGQAGVILKNIVGLVTGIGKVAAGLPFAATSPAEDFYAGEFPELAKRRVTIRAAINSMLDKTIVLHEKLVVETDPKKREALRAEASDLQKALGVLRLEADPLDAHFAAWKARKEDAKQQSYEWVIDVDDLVSEEPNLAQKPLAQIKAAAKAQMKEIIDTLRIVVSLEAPKITVGAPIKPVNGSHSDAIYHRVVLPSTIRVYRIKGDDSLELIRATTAAVLSRTSPLALLPAPDSKWSKKSLAATFSGGVLTKIAAEASSELAGATDALRSLPAEYLAGLKQANEIAGEQRKLSLQSIDARIEQLKKQKDVAEAELAQQQAVSVGTAKASITELETQIKLLETQRLFSDAQGAASDRNALRLENEMVKLQLEQADLRRKLEAIAKEIIK